MGVSPVPITVSSFKSFFDRDFTYGATINEVRDADISKAMSVAAMLFNSALWDNTTDQATAFEYLTAHCLVRDIGNVGGIGMVGNGINSQGTAPMQSKGVGSISVSLAMPPEVINNPSLNQFMTTGYGMKYLQMLLPNLVGNIATAYRDTMP